MHLTVMNSGIDGAYLEREPLWNWIEAAVAEGVAAQYAPGRKQASSQDPKTPDRLGGIARATRLVAAAPGESR